MFHLFAENPVRFILALLIGLATAWWIWGRRGHARAVPEPESDGAPAPTPAPATPMTEAPREPLKVAEVEDKTSPAPKIAPAVGAPDDLTRIRGIGPKLQERCHALGVTRYDQIAAWSADDIAEVDSHLKTFRGRIVRDQWVAQARLLANGKDETHKREFG